MRKLDILIRSAFHALYLLISCVTCMVAEMLIIRVLTLCFEIDYFTLCIIRAAIYLVGVNAILAIVSFREGYREASCRILDTVLSGVFGTVIHFFFALLFSFEAFCAGGVKFLTALVKFGPSLSDSTFMGELYRTDFIPVFFVNGLICCAVATIFNVLGAKKRLADRAILTGSQESTPVSDEE